MLSHFRWLLCTQCSPIVQLLLFSLIRDDWALYMLCVESGAPFLVYVNQRCLFLLMMVGGSCLYHYYFDIFVFNKDCYFFIDWFLACIFYHNPVAHSYGPLGSSVCLPFFCLYNRKLVAQCISGSSTGFFFSLYLQGLKRDTTYKKAHVLQRCTTIF